MADSGIHTEQRWYPNYDKHSPIIKGNKMKNLFGIILAVSAINFAVPVSAATTDAKETYNATVTKAAADFKVARAHCDTITGNAKDVCVAEAKAAQVHTEANASATYKATPAARTAARNDIADADFDVSKAKCGALNGNPKDVCLKEAKAAMIAAKADATADKKVGEARKDAYQDKTDAEYKVAVEKCDAMAGATKDDCLAVAKTHYGK
jgi:hypothetical protein